MDRKTEFIELAKIAILEYSANHPGHWIAASMLEEFYKITEEQIAAAYEQHGSLAPAIKEMILYEFTAGRGEFKEPAWHKKV